MPALRTRPRVTTLEDRTVPATIDVVNGVLTYSAATGEQHQLIVSAYTNDLIFDHRLESSSPEPVLGSGAVAAGWTVSDDQAFGPLAGVSAVEIRLGSGADSVFFDYFAAPIARLLVDGGGGVNDLSVTQMNEATTSGDTLAQGVLVDGSITIDKFDRVGFGHTVVAVGAVTVRLPDLTTTQGHVTINAPVSGSSVTIQGGRGNDKLTISYPATDINLVPGGLTFDGRAGNNSVTLSDNMTTSGHAYAVSGGGLTRDGVLLATRNVQETSLLTSHGDDRITVSLSPTTAIRVLAGGGNDLLNFHTPASLRTSRTADGHAGTAAMAGRKAVSFSGAEMLTPAPALRATMMSPTRAVENGGTAIFVYTLTNTGGTPLTGVAIAEALTRADGAVPIETFLERLFWEATASAGSSVSAASGSGPVGLTATLAAGGSVTVTVSGKLRADAAQATYRIAGTAPSTDDAVPGASAATELTVMAAPTGRPSARPKELWAVGTGPGGQPLVRVYNGDRSVRFEVMAYDASFRGGVNVATADVTGDGVEDLITGAGVGGGPHVRIFDGQTGKLAAEWMAYAESFRGGVTVAAGHIVGNERADVVTGPAMGGGPHIKVYDGASGIVAREWMAFDEKFRGGVSIAVGDIGYVPSVADSVPGPDGADDVIVGAGTGGAPTVRVFDVKSGAAMFREVTPYAADFRGGVAVAAGDVTGDGQMDIVTGAGTGGGPHVKVFDGKDLSEFRSFFAFGLETRGGVRVATADLNADAKADVLAGTGQGDGAAFVATDGALGTELFRRTFDANLRDGLAVG